MIGSSAAYLKETGKQLASQPLAQRAPRTAVMDSAAEFLHYYGYTWHDTDTNNNDHYRNMSGEEVHVSPGGDMLGTEGYPEPGVVASWYGEDKPDPKALAAFRLSLGKKARASVHRVKAGVQPIQETVGRSLTEEEEAAQGEAARAMAKKRAAASIRTPAEQAEAEETLRMRKLHRQQQAEEAARQYRERRK